MRSLSETELPLRVERTIVFSEDDAQAFRLCLHQKSKATPPTMWVKALKGMFELIDQLEVDWRNLLHISQSFDYRSPLSLPCSVECETKLVRIKSRAQSRWLYFESDLRKRGSEPVSIHVEALIVVQVNHA